MKTHILFKQLTVVLLMSVMPVMLGHTRYSEQVELPRLDCTECHTCDAPTMDEPCLTACPRTAVVHRTAKHTPREAPDSMLLDDLTGYYQPVHFIHKRHALMAEMGEGCPTCHHYSPEGHIPACRECHGKGSGPADLRRPNLKGAYHRQCLSCHREWSHDTKCVVCHAPVEPRPGLSAIPADPTDILGVYHPPVTEPITKLYRTTYESGPLVTFHHKEHIELFGFRCVDCHREENCDRCHDLAKPAVAEKSHEEMHAVCSNCHHLGICEKCHSVKERPGFSHRTTGWPLNQYHMKLDCRSCHPKGKRLFKLSRECLSCHPDWSQETFRHAVTGLELDETHLEVDCTDCHIDGKFEVKPMCVDCHDDGRTAQNNPPGTWVKGSAN